MLLEYYFAMQRLNIFYEQFFLGKWHNTKVEFSMET